MKKVNYWKIEKREAGYIIGLGRGRFVKEGIGLRSPVKVWKTIKGITKYGLSRFGNNSSN